MSPKQKSIDLEPHISARFLKARFAAWASVSLLLIVGGLFLPFNHRFRVCDDVVAQSNVVRACKAPSVGLTPFFVVVVVGLVLLWPEVIAAAKTLKTISIELGQLKVSADIDQLRQKADDTQRTTEAALAEVAHVGEAVESLAAGQRRQLIDDLDEIDPADIARNMPYGAQPLPAVVDSEEQSRSFRDALSALQATLDVRSAEGDPAFRARWMGLFNREMLSLEALEQELLKGHAVPAHSVERGLSIVAELERSLVSNP